MSRVRVLVVEDDPSVRGLLQTLLVAEGYDVSTASDGLGGLGQIAHAAPAVDQAPTLPATCARA